MKYVALSISIAITAFAFIMSFQSGNVSSDISGSISTQIYEIFISVFKNTNVPFDTFHLWIRKLAHITEYLLLGISWTVSFHLFDIKLSYALVVGICIACIDEGIQLFTPERGASIIDILIFDYASFVFGYLISRKFTQYKK